MNASPLPSMPPVGGFLSQPGEGRTIQLASRRLRSSVAVISAQGHIDASNADTVTAYTVGHLVRCRGLILDLRSLDFFGTEGFSALHRVSVCCARAGIGWAVVSGEAASRVLQIGDPEGLLPAARTVEAAMAAIQDQPHHPAQPDYGITATASRRGDEPDWPTHGALSHARWRMAHTAKWATGGVDSAAMAD
jgi:anti-anti-sigma factor